MAALAATGADILGYDVREYEPWCVKLLGGLSVEFANKVRVHLPELYTLSQEEQRKRQGGPQVAEGLAYCSWPSVGARAERDTVEARPPAAAEPEGGFPRWRLGSLAIGLTVAIIVVLGLATGRIWPSRKLSREEPRLLTHAEVGIIPEGSMPDGAQPNKPEALDLLKDETQQSRNFKTVSKIVADYHKTHTYVGRDIFVCGDMASDVWNALITKGINAKIMIGNVEKDFLVEEPNHAWVMAEVSDGTWLALETTGGFVVYLEDNGRYYRGHLFSNPKELRTYSDLQRDFAATQRKYNEAWRDCEPKGIRFNRASQDEKVMLLDELNASLALVDQRIGDLFRASVALKAFKTRTLCTNAPLPIR